MNISDNKKWLIAITVILVGIFIVLIMNVASPKSRGEKIGTSISGVIDNARDEAEEFREEVIDEIDDHTDSQ